MIQANGAKKWEVEVIVYGEKEKSIFQKHSRATIPKTFGILSWESSTGIMTRELRISQLHIGKFMMKA